MVFAGTTKKARRAAWLKQAFVAVAVATCGAGFAHAQDIPGPAAADTPSVSSGAQAADLAYRSGEFEEAIKAATGAIQADRNDHIAYYLRGSAKVEEGLMSGNAQMVREGVADAREAIRIEGSGKADYYLPYLYGMTNLATLEGKESHAETTTKVVDSVIARSALTPDEEANLRYQKAMALVLLKKTDGTISELEEACKLSPNHMAAQMMLADTYVRAGQPDKAEAQFTKVIERNADNPLAYNNRAMFRQANGNLEGAIADFDKSVELEPAFFQAVTNKGFALMKAGRAAEAIAAFDQSIKMNPDQPGAISLRGTTKLNSSDLRGAAADYRQVLEMDGRNPSAHADLGFVYFFARQYDSAAKSFANAQKVDPKMTFLDPWKYYAMSKGPNAASAAGEFAAISKKLPAQLTWPDRIVMFLMDRLTEEQLVASANRENENIREAQLTEANYFIGLKSLGAGDQAAAQPYLQKAASSKADNLSAHRGAKITLQILGNTATR